MWVKLDKDQIMIGNPCLEDDEEYIYEPYLNGLKDKLKKIYDEIKALNGNTLSSDNL